ncbi:MAG: hypothetical protein ABGZ17_28875, partial [Planctomycetaceae bacterium]
MSEHSVDHTADTPGLGFELLQFADEWWSTRPHGSFFGGTLTLILGGLLCGLGLVAVTWPDHMFVDRYRSAANTSCAASDWSTADLMYRRLRNMGCSDSEVQLGLARVAAEVGDSETATALMNQLAASTQPGRVQAHLWLAQQLVASDSRLSQDQSQRLIGHLSEVVDREPDHRLARGMLGTALAGVGEWDEAAAHLKHVREDRLGWKLTLARVEARRGRVASAAQYAKEVVARLERELESQPDDVGLRLKLGNACMLCGDLSRAERILVAGLSNGEQQSLRQALARVYLTAARRCERAPHMDRSEVVHLLIRAHSQDSKMPEVLDKLAWHMGSQVRMPPQLVDDVRAFLNHGLDPERDVPDSRVIIALGQIAVRQSDDPQAIARYRSVVTRHP